MGFLVGLDLGLKGTGKAWAGRGRGGTLPGILFMVGLWFRVQGEGFMI